MEKGMALNYPFFATNVCLIYCAYYAIIWRRGAFYETTEKNDI